MIFKGFTFKDVCVFEGGGGGGGHVCFEYFNKHVCCTKITQINAQIPTGEQNHPKFSTNSSQKLH